jgi:hypothetical protein
MVTVSPSGRRPTTRSAVAQTTGHIVRISNIATRTIDAQARVVPEDGLSTDETSTLLNMRGGIHSVSRAVSRVRSRC